MSNDEEVEMVQPESEEFSAQSNDDGASNFSALYKNAGKNMSASQQQRRDMLLTTQKENRHEVVDGHRNLEEQLNELESYNEGDIDNKDENKEMQVDSCYRTSKKLKFQLMMSEWLAEIPEDLAENWLMKLCPLGQRRIVITFKGKTCCYTKRGRLAFKFQSRFQYGSEITVLDCIYTNHARTFFILDVLSWRSMPLINCNVECRDYFLKSRFSENPILSEPMKSNGIRFKLVEWLPMEPSLMQDLISNPIKINDADIFYDGVLFYHKEGLYVEGHTPLVGWLKPFMLPEVFNIEVPENYKIKKPTHYVSFNSFMQSKLQNVLAANDEMDAEELA